MPHRIEQQCQHFDSIAQEYYQRRQHANHLCFKGQLWKHFLKHHADILPKGANVLEAMCGYGEGYAILREHLHGDFHYTGFDNCPELVEQAQKTYPDATIFVQDVTVFEPQERYDLIVLIGGLHHVYGQTAEVLARLRGALKPGGYMLSVEPTHANPLWAWVRGRIYAKNAFFDEGSEKGYGLKELNQLYRDTGLRVVDQIWPGMLGYVLYYNPDAFPRLNIGTPFWVKALAGIEASFYRTGLARCLSFCSFSLLRADG